MREWRRRAPGQRAYSSELPLTVADEELHVLLQRDYVRRAADLIDEELSLFEADQDSVIGIEFPRSNIERYIGKCFRNLAAIEQYDPDARITFGDFQPRFARIFNTRTYDLLMAAHEQAAMCLIEETPIVSELPFPLEPPTQPLPSED